MPSRAPIATPAARFAVQPAPRSWVSDRFFLAMLAGYRASGGLARAAEIVVWLERGLGLDPHQLQRWRAERGVLCFDWQAQTWLPRFQFTHKGMVPDPCVRMVLAELGSVFDDTEMAQWFATPNPSLADGAPVDRIREQPLSVLRAARCDRFVAEG